MGDFPKFSHIFRWPGQNVTQMSWMIHTQPTYDPVAQWNKVFIENTIIFISKMCGCVHTLQHVHTRHATYCFSISSHHIMHRPVNNAS